MSKLLSHHLSLADFEISARKLLPKPLYAYVQGGVEDNLTLYANRQAFDDYFLKPNVLVDVSTRDISVDLFGHRYSAPVGIAPMGIAALTGYRGDLSLAQAAAAANVPFVMSGSSLIRLEEVVDAAPNIWFQAYLPGDTVKIAPLIERVRKAGVKTLVITVDTPVKANRENNVRAGFSTPLRPSVAGLPRGDASALVVWNLPAHACEAWNALLREQLRDPGGTGLVCKRCARLHRPRPSELGARAPDPSAVARRDGD